MRYTGRYCKASSPFDLDHEITEHVTQTKKFLLDLDDSYNSNETKAIKKAILETIIESL